MDRVLRSAYVVLFLVAALLNAAWPPAQLRAQEPSVAEPATPAQTTRRIYLPLLASSAGLPSFTLIYPEAGATVGGTSIVAARALVASSVTSISFRAGSLDLGTDTTPADGYQAFLDAAQLPVGPVTITATARGPKGEATQTLAVIAQPAPPSSGTIGSRGGVLGVASGATITILPGAVSGSATISVRERSQSEVTTEAGIQWDTLGLTFLGDLALSSSQPLLRPVGVATRGYAARIPGGQAVITYNLLPDQDGDGAAELVMAGQAQVAPNGAIVSSLPQDLSSTSCQPTAGTGTPASRGIVAAPITGGDICGTVRDGSADRTGRYLIKLFTRSGDRALSPFAGVTDASGAFFLPFVPQDEPFRAVAIDTRTGLTRSITGVGPVTGISTRLDFDFSGVQAQRFPIALDDTVSDGVPQAGAGNIETTDAVDVYTFTAEADRQISLEVLSEAPGLASTRWKLTTATGRVVFDRNLANTGVVSLPGVGTYTLAVGDDSSPGAGAYVFRLVGLPLPSRFALAIGDSVSNGVPAAGAGNIETPYGKDIYIFTAAAEQRVFFDVQNVAASLGEVNWRLVEPSGRVLFNQPLGFGGGVDPGIYTLPVTGTYTIIVGDDLDAATGTYGFQVRNPPEPQTFAIAIGDTVANDLPAAGAGNIEFPYGSDIYTFAGSAGQRVLFEQQAVAATLSGVNWRLIAPDGAVLFDLKRAQDNGISGAYTLPVAGTYSISIGDDRDAGTGTYGFRLGSAPASQQFAIAIGTRVSNGAPAVGAGNIESPYGQDIYTFTASAGQLIAITLERVDALIASSDAQLVAPDGRVIAGSSISSIGGIYRLPSAGTYSFVVSARNNTGTYAFRLEDPPAPQTFAIAVGNSVSDGVPAAGAGNIEVDFAKDIYTFTASAGQRILFDAQEITPTLNSVDVRLLAPDGRVIFSDLLRFLSGVYTLPVAGSYALVIGDDREEGTGTYRFWLSSPPTPQQFTIALGARVSDGVPAAGAGNIEAPFGQDIYTFTVGAGQLIAIALESVDALIASDASAVQLLTPDGRVFVSTTLSSFDGVYRLLVAGTYTLIVGGNDESGIGTYSFRLEEPPPPQQFTIVLGGRVSNGVPETGAGNIELPFAQDVYTFTANAGQRVFIALDLPGDLNALNWRLLAPDGSVLLNRFGDDSDLAVRTLPAAGTYTLVFASDSGTGTYSFQLGLQAAPQQFAIAIGDTVANDQPAAGAGNIETAAARDIYTFAALAGQRILIEPVSMDAGLSDVRWQLTRPDGRDVFASSGPGSGDPQEYILRVAGIYTLLVGDTLDAGTGSYSFRIRSLPTPEQFVITIGDTIANGVPAAGAGNIEVPYGQDIYTFNATKGQSIVVNFQSVVAALSQARWRLVGPSGNFDYFNDRLGSGDQTPRSLSESGTYTMIVGDTDNPAIGTYSFQIRLE